MKGDFTRFTFDPANDFDGVLMQQGRVQLDADWNEQLAIARHLRETTEAAVIGRAGVPKGGSGFAIGLAAGGADLSIAAGRMFVDGQVCDNRATAATLLNQPNLARASATRPGIDLPAASGRYIVYLDLWRRHITADRAPAIRETALGGPDTATREKIIWQVRLAPAPAATTRCADLPADWKPTGTSTGMLSAATPSTGTGTPCILPPTAGYRSLDNQLYRVEILRGGPRDGGTPASFTWSRDNGTVVTIVQASGQTLTAASLGHDDFTSFADGQWVEIVDDWMDLAQHRGTLLKVLHVDPGKSTIEIDPATPVPAVDDSRPVLLHRWDQAGDANGVPLGAAAIPLEAGLQVSFAAGTYNPGDYWLIPARTAISGETGQVEWPSDGTGPLALPPRGIAHHYARLALVDYDAGTKRFTFVENCRLSFPPLTDIDAADIGFDNTICKFDAGVRTVQQAIDALCARGGDHCTVSLAPGDDLQKLLDTLPENADANVCLRAGLYTLAKPLVIARKGLRLLIAGGGPGTRLVAAHGERVLSISGCASVTVRDCAFTASIAGDAHDGEAGINGALTIAGCPDVEVRSCHFACAPAGARAASCVTVRSGQPAPARLRVADCSFSVGHAQYGILSEGMDVVDVSGNEIAAAGPLPMVHLRWRALARAMIGRPQVGAVGAAIPGKPNMVTVGGVALFYALDPSLGPGIDIQAFVRSHGLPAKMSARGARRWLMQALQDRIRRTARGRAPRTALDRAMARLIKGETPAAAAGIVVAGDRAGEVGIAGNRIAGALHGIVVAPSHHGAGIAVVDRIRITGNSIALGAASGMQARIGVLIGSSRSLLVTENRIAAASAVVPQRGHGEGLRVFGAVGNFVVLRANHISGVAVGITFHPLGMANPPPKPQWIVTDNLAERAAAAVVTPGPAIRARLRGVDDNYT